MRSIVFISLPSLALAAAAHAVPPAYSITDLGTLTPGATYFEPGSVGFAINDAGTIAGYAVTNLPNRNFHGFRFANGLMADLGVYNGDEHSIAYAINDAGSVVGISYKLGETFVHGVLWPAGGSAVSLGTVEPHDINASGSIAASTPIAGSLGVSHAALVVGSSVTDLGTLGGASSTGLAINDAGWVVGESLLADNKTPRGFVWRNGSLLSLPTLGGTTGRAQDISGLHVVGMSDTPSGGAPHATLWTLDQLGNLASTTDLGTLPGRASSAALAVGANGVVLGTSGDLAFMSTPNGLVDLNGLIPSGAGWQLVKATGINADGSIVGVGRHYGQQRAFLLTPAPAADFNGDGHVDAADLSMLLGAWNQKGTQFDLSGDGVVGPEDLAYLLSAWG